MTATARAAGVEVLAPGLATSVQDRGRQGLRHLGVTGAGAADPWAHALANLLVGNAEGAASLEITLAGPELRFLRPARIALCGAGIEAEADGAAVPGHRPVDLPAGATLRLGRCLDGARSYLAVAGGFAVAPVLGSASADLRGGFGGHAGRPLQRGDRLAVGNAPDRQVARVAAAAWWIDASPSPDLLPREAPRLVRVLPGRHRAAGLFARDWAVDARSDRQGVRLSGDALALDDAGEQVSEPVLAGTLQLPPDGQPIALLCEAQTHGGYPRIGHAIRADWPLLAQARPGDRLRFAACTPAEAHRARREQHQRFHRIALAVGRQSSAT